MGPNGPWWAEPTSFYKVYNIVGGQEIKLEKDKQVYVISKILYFDTLSKVENTFFIVNILDRVVKKDLSLKDEEKSTMWKTSKEETVKVRKELGLCKEQKKTSVVWIRCS